MSRKTEIETLLRAEFKPELLELIDESSQHQVPVDAQSHFKCIIVSKTFVDLTSIARQRAVYKILGAEFNKGLHAFSLNCYSPKEWLEKPRMPLGSPNCQHT